MATEKKYQATAWQLHHSQKIWRAIKTATTNNTCSNRGKATTAMAITSFANDISKQLKQQCGNRGILATTVATEEKQ